MNRERLLQLCDVIEAEAKRADAGMSEAASFDMAAWACFKPENVCSTSLCAAGHAAKLAHPEGKFLFMENDGKAHSMRFLNELGRERIRLVVEIAKEYLSLRDNIHYQIFYDDDWCDASYGAYVNATTNLGRALAFRQQVNHLIHEDNNRLRDEAHLNEEKLI